MPGPVHVPRLSRRQVLVAGLAAAPAAAAVACAPGGGAGGDAAGQGAAGRSGASGTVRYMAWGNAFSDAIENKVVDAFHAKQDKVKVEFTNTGSGDAFEKITTMLAAGDPPDTALVDGYNVRTLVKRGGTVDVTQRMQRDGVKKEDYVDSWFDEFLYRGKYHYHPNMRGSTASFFYNKDLIERTGGKVPTEGWTLNDWLDISTRATRDDFVGTERPGLWWPFLWVNGAELIDEEKNVCLLDSSAAIDSLQFLQDMVHKNKVTRNSVPGTLGAADLFVQGKLATVHSWFTEIPRYRQEIKDFTWDTVVMAQGKQRKQVGLYKGNGEVLLQGAKNPDAAWEFMKFLGGYEGMLIYGMEGRFVPALKKANQDPQFLKSGKAPLNLGTFTDNRVKTLPLMPEWNDFNREIWTPNLNRIWNNEAPAKEVAPEIARLTTDFIKNREKY
ncbi:MAG TPA: sugar ABC transporter substrate-binding protein [Chloroflexota bacterium]|nr:sugar ABC transporter substrate-binding protein [Chloroflexota bacterium]